MIQDVLSNHVLELLRANTLADKVTWPGPIVRELVAEVQWLQDELRMQPMVNTARQTSLPAIESYSRFDPTNQRAIELQTLLMVTNSATLFLDHQLNIKRFTPKVRELFDISPLDQGQPLTRLGNRLDCTSLVDDAFEVLRSQTHIERETRNRADQWFLMRMLPYRTLDDRIGGVIITFLDITRLKETETRLKESQQQTEALTEKLETVMAEQMERVRQLASEVLITEQKVQQAIAQVLHDELQQVLYSIQRQLKEIQPMLPGGDLGLGERMQRLREAAVLAFDITRQVTVDLKPPVLLSQDFTESLEWLAALMKDRYGLEVEVKIAMWSNWPGHEVSTLLFQTVRELLFNVVKHAGVNQAKVEMVAEDGRLSLTVSDQGQGFDVAAALVARPHRGGLGLFGIRNRLELLGGQFSIESQADQGTRATIVVLV